MMQILMPMAGEARPFREAGYSFPKPLIEIFGRPLVEYAIASSAPARPHRFVFVIEGKDCVKFRTDVVLRRLAPDCAIVKTVGATGGALCTALLGADHLDPGQPLLVCNADQYLGRGAVDEALADFEAHDLDVGILTFTAIHPRWSFARRDQDGMVIETAEKNPISDEATVGLYYYRNAGLFLRSAEQALTKNRLYNSQFYTCPSINELILEGCRVGAYRIANPRFISLGTPEDVAAFKQHTDRSPLDQPLEDVTA